MTPDQHAKLMQAARAWLYKNVYGFTDTQTTALVTLLTAQRAAGMEEGRNVYEPLRKAAEQVVHAGGLTEAKQAVRLMNSELLKLNASEAQGAATMSKINLLLSEKVHRGQIETQEH